MESLKLLLVEDNPGDVQAFKDTVTMYNEKYQLKIMPTICTTVEEAFKRLDSSYDGAIIDLRLAGQGDEGNQVIKRIEESYFRIPVIILTGTPDAVDSSHTYIDILKKGDLGAEYESIFNIFREIYNTGLTRILGGRGKIEKSLNDVFRLNLLPQMDKWRGYGRKHPERTEDALLRYTLSYLLHLLDNDKNKSFPEEMYLYPLHDKVIRTGCIVRERKSGQAYVILTPACDLVLREDKRNTDRFLLVEIDPHSSLFPEPATSASKKQEEERAFRNNKLQCHHWLPRTKFFEGGFINFRKLTNLPFQEFEDRFGEPLIQISPAFVKDIIARFSGYYARQGQPEIDFTHREPEPYDEGSGAD